MSVDLPEPDGPMTAANCPRGNVTSTPRRASTAASPTPNVRFRPIALTAAPVALAVVSAARSSLSPLTATSSLCTPPSTLDERRRAGSPEASLECRR